MTFFENYTAEDFARYKAEQGMAMEVDDLLIDLAASMADVIGLQAGFVQGDAVRPQNAQRKVTWSLATCLSVIILMMPLRRAIKLLLVTNILTLITCSWNKGLSISSQMDTLFSSSE